MGDGVIAPTLATAARLRRRLTGAPSPLAGRVVLVTGASSGIGEHTAYAAARAGARLLLVARRADELERVAEAVRGLGAEASTYTCDLTDGHAIDALVVQVLAEHGHVDHLVNNAGRSIRRSLAASADRFHDVERTMAINYFGPVRLTMGLLPAMRSQGFGHVVNVVSWGVQLKAPKFSAYLASKAAIDTWGRILAREARSDGVHVTNMRFGLVKTPMIAPTKEYENQRAMTAEQAGEQVRRVMEDLPPTWGHPVGYVGEAFGLLAPRITDAVMHRLHQKIPDAR
ncbi:MAG: SDR family NAD(P)-dependent oxidoreductase [Actinobacteria bacterium]|nr:SDR family NAD(P)-dependent oxidoreductase [Actinomycetota bacterium]